MALACDIIVAVNSASFALPEPRVGLAAVSGGFHRLPRQIGLKQAMGMILTGRRASASECLARQTEFAAMKEMYSSNDFIEGPRAFAEKRLARWQAG